MNDPSTDNPRLLTLAGEEEHIAIEEAFAAGERVTHLLDPLRPGTVDGTGRYGVAVTWDDGFAFLYAPDLLRRV